MTTRQILAELPKLAPAERAEVFEELCQLQEADILNGRAPSAEERALLDKELAAFEQDRDAGKPWRDVFRLLTNRTTRKPEPNWR